MNLVRCAFQRDLNRLDRTTLLSLTPSPYLGDFHVLLFVIIQDGQRLIEEDSNAIVDTFSIVVNDDRNVHNVLPTVSSTPPESS